MSPFSYGSLLNPGLARVPVLSHPPLLKTFQHKVCNSEPPYTLQNYCPQLGSEFCSVLTGIESRASEDVLGSEEFVSRLP